jgi:hypothetical protein
MRFVKTHIAGAYEDAYLYMGRVVLTTAKRTAISFPVRAIGETVARTTPELPFLSEALFRRNDWLESELFSALRSSSGIETVLNSGLDRLVGHPIEIDLPLVKSREQELPISTDVILSALFYSQALFISGSGGFFKIDCDWNEEGYLTCETAHKRHDGKSLSATARLGAVNISCGSDGLFTEFDAFGRSDAKSSSLRRISDSSLRTTWMRGDLVNYRNSRTPELLRSEKASKDSSSKPVVTDFSTHPIELNSIASNVRAGTAHEAVTFSYFADNIGFQQLASSDCVTFEMSLPTKKGAVTRVKSTQRSPKVQGRIITAHRSAEGLVLRTSRGVYLMHGPHIETIHEGRVIAVRTFSDSKHYQNLISIVVEEGILFVAVVPT